jgi:serine/threonine protein kinase
MRIGTFYYMAPEVVKGNVYNQKIDVYSFSIIMYDVFFGYCNNFFGNKTEFGLKFKIANGLRP